MYESQGSKFDEYYVKKLDTFSIIVTSKCNSKCIQCRYWTLSESTISIQEIKELLDFLKKYQVSKICITGGEPTLHPRITEILKIFRTQMPPETKIVLFSNGLILDEYIDKISSHVDIYVISLDAATSATYRRIRGTSGFQRVINAIKLIKIKNFKAYIELTCTVQRENLKELKDLFILAAKLKVNSIKFITPVIRPGVFGWSGKSKKGEYVQKLIKHDNNILTETLIDLLKLSDNYCLHNNLKDLLRILRSENRSFVA
ncbi:MAG: radical SAM protein [Nitrososphaeria archaeon]